VTFIFSQTDVDHPNDKAQCHEGSDALQRTAGI